MGLASRGPTLVNMGVLLGVDPSPSPPPYIRVASKTLCGERVDAVLYVWNLPWLGPVSVIRVWYLCVAFLKVK